MYFSLGTGDSQRQTQKGRLHTSGRAHVPEGHLTPRSTNKFNEQNHDLRSRVGVTTVLFPFPNTDAQKHQ